MWIVVVAEPIGRELRRHIFDFRREAIGAVRRPLRSV